MATEHSAGISRRSSRAGEPAALTAVEDYQAALEEIQVAEEELRQQNEELIRTRNDLETERHRYQELFEFAPDAYLVTDARGRILEANLAANRLFNVPPPFLVKKPLFLFIASEDRQQVHDLLHSLDRRPGPRVTFLRDGRWEVRDSNLRPPACKAGALPLS